MFKEDNTPEKFMEDAARRRRCAEAERKSRIFNPRQRVIGLDIDGLNRQVHENQKKEAARKLQEQTYDALEKMQMEALLQQDLDEQKLRQQLQKNLNQFWANQQRDECIKPEIGLKGAFNLTLPEHKLGPSSMHLFEGEDIHRPRINVEQTAETKRELEKQIEENKKRRDEEKYRDLMMERERMRQNEEQFCLGEMEEAQRKASLMAVSNFNQILAADQRHRREVQQTQEEKENQAEMLHVMTSDMMTECGTAEPNDYGVGKIQHVYPDRWKGMTPAQQEAIFKQREKQCLEKKRQLDAEKFQSATWDLMYLKLSDEAVEEDRKTAEKKRNLRQQMDEYNKKLAKDQRLRREYEDNTLYTNKPTKDYYNQFNTSSR